VALLDNEQAWPQRRLAVWGGEGCGKTHLLHRWATRRHAAILAGEHLPAALPTGPSAIDDADLAGEHNLLHHLNASAEQGFAVVIASRAAPARWSVRLPDLASRLRAKGHDVHSPTLAGMGEHTHLLSRQITLDTHVDDVVSHIETEELEKVVLVGHSYGGLIITGAADRLDGSGKIASLVYLDALAPVDGSRWSDFNLPAAAEARHASAKKAGGLFMPPPDAAMFGLTDPADIAWGNRRLHDRRRLFPDGRHRLSRPGRISVHRRPQEGHHHQGWRKHQLPGSGSGHLCPSRNCRSLRIRLGRRAVG
jgi:pimeloyl-ACP methyl ester carboxylesterase